jgi:glycosyltransferase involved in cell wall biosynthesis
VDPDSPAQIARAVEDIMAHPEKAATVRETARDMVRSRYGWDLVAARIRGLFDRVAGEG